MKTGWKTLIGRMPTLLQKLERSRPRRVGGDLWNLPREGVYVLYENERAIYVGHAGKMKEVLEGHYRSNDTVFSFAWTLAREEAQGRGIAVKGREWHMFQSLVPRPEQFAAFTIEGYEKA